MVLVSWRFSLELIFYQFFEFQAVNFYHIHSFPQLLPYLLSSSHCSAVSFLFHFSFHWALCMWANHSWGEPALECGQPTGGGGYCEKTDSPTHRSYQIASQLGMGPCACLPHPCWDLICFGYILPKSIISLRFKKKWSSSQSALTMPWPFFSIHVEWSYARFDKNLNWGT